MALSEEEKRKIQSRLDKLLNPPQQKMGHEAILEWACRTRVFASELLGASDYRVREIEKAINRFNAKPANQRSEMIPDIYATLRANLSAIKKDLTDGHVVNARNQVRSELENELPTHAHGLLELELKNPCAMLLGAVLELRLQYLR
ncbi:MAG: hypothetical protein BroJett039_06440 [Chloroflexota bacterium]|nr:MAG: hypothetical protein BroJett039_06440 [Chloroflexota bacterium]